MLTITPPGHIYVFFRMNAFLKLASLDNIVFMRCLNRCLNGDV